MTERLCPGCRSLDGEHTFRPPCTLVEDEAGAAANALASAIRAESAGAPGFSIPWQVRYVRWWWRREARYHANCKGTRLYDRKWHLGQMRQAVAYAANAVPFWRESGKLPLVAVRRGLAEARMSGAVPYPEALEGSCADPDSPWFKANASRLAATGARVP